MKKMIPVVLILLFASISNADVVYLNNGQSFRANLIRVTSRDIIVTMGGITEIDFEKSTIARVEDEDGNILYPGKKVIVPDPLVSEPSEVVVPEIQEPKNSDVDTDYLESEPSEVTVPEQPGPEPAGVAASPSGSGPSEVAVPEHPGPEPSDVAASPSGSEPSEVAVPENQEPEPSGAAISPSESEPSEVAIAEPPGSEYRDDGEVGIVYTAPSQSVRVHRFYSRALHEGSIALGGLVSFSSFGGDINEGVYGIENDERLNLFAIAPNIAYFVRDNIGLGADVLYNREWLNSRFQDKLSLGPRAIYAFPLEKAFRPYIAVGMGLMWWRFHENERAYSDIGMTVKVGPGLFYFVNKNYAVNMELTYSWDRFGTDQEVYPITGNTLLFSIGLSGFIY